MKKKRILLLLATILVLLVGVASATEVSKDITDTNSNTKEVVRHDTYDVSDATKIQEDKVDENIQSDNASNDKLVENPTIAKNTKKSNLKAATPITNWKQLQSAVKNADRKNNVTIKLGEGTYINTGTITWSNKNTLTIDGNGQTIDGNQQKAFAITSLASMVFKNITIINSKSVNGGAIESIGNLTILDSTLANNTATRYGGAVYIKYDKLRINNTIIANNTAQAGAAVYNDEGIVIINNSILANNKASISGGAVETTHRLNITSSVLENNTARRYGGAIYNLLSRPCNLINVNFTNNHAETGGAIYSFAEEIIKDSTFTNNTANNKETIYLSYYEGQCKNNVYNSTDIRLKTINLRLKDKKTIYPVGEDVVLNFTLELNNAKFYDKDILERLDDITIYVNDVEYDITNYKNYTLSNLKAGEYNVYFKTCNRKSNNVTFTVYSITNWDELRDAVDVAKTKTEPIILKLNKGNYTNTGTINWNNTSNMLTIDGKGQTIDAKQQLAFNIDSNASLSLKNITIQNAKSEYGAIQNDGRLTITDSTLSNNTGLHNGGAIHNNGILTIIKSTLADNNAAYDGGAIYNNEILNITKSKLINNTANYNGGAIRNGQNKFDITSTKFIGNHAQKGGAIFTLGNSNLTGNTFTNNTANNWETIDLYGYDNGYADYNEYKTTDISLKSIDLRIKNNRTLFNLGERVILNYTIALEHPQYYDDDITENLDNITIYINGVKNFTTTFMENVLSGLKHGEYTVYIKSRNQESNPVTFKVVSVNLSTEVTPTHLIVTAKDDKGNIITDGTITTNITEGNYYPDENGQVFISLRNMKGGRKYVNVSYTDDTSYIKSSTNTSFYIYYPNKKINVTTWDVEMVRARGVTLSANIYYENMTVNEEKAYFIIDDKPILNENGSVQYVSVKNSRADLLYQTPSDITLGNHSLTAVYVRYVTAWNLDDKTLTIIDKIPEGAGEKEDIPSEDGKQATYKQDIRPYKALTKYTKMGHKVSVGNNVISVGNTITLGKLNEIFHQTFINGHLILYINGEVVFNGTVGDDLAMVILEIIEKFRGQNELKVEFTDADGKTNTYTENITIN